MTEVEVNGVQIRALIDSGATKSIAPINLAQSFGITLNPTDNRRKWLMADNMSASSVLGTAKVRLLLRGSIIEQKLVFTDKLAYDLIIWVEVLAELGCRIDYSRRTIKTERANISFDCSHDTNSVVVALQETIMVEPGSVKVLWAKRPPEFTGDIMIEGLLKQVIDYVCTDGDDLPIMIVYKRSRNLTLERGTLMYRMSRFEEHDRSNTSTKLESAVKASETISSVLEVPDNN